MYFLCVCVYICTPPISIISPNWKKIIIKKNNPKNLITYKEKGGASCRDFNAPKGDLAKEKKTVSDGFCCSKEEEEEEEEAVHNPIKCKKEKKKG